MPTYDYKCGSCDHKWELFQSIKAKPVRKCPSCGKQKAQRVIGPGLRITVHESHEGVEFTSDTPLYRAIESTLARHDPEGVPVPYMIPGFTDSFAYARLGAICYGFSPVRLGPELDFTGMYHGHDERIPVAGFKWGLNVLYEAVRDFVTQ